MTTPPSYSLIAFARASMELMSKWLVGSSVDGYQLIVPCEIGYQRNYREGGYADVP
jgi:hypothetical protein